MTGKTYKIRLTFDRKGRSNFRISSVILTRKFFGKKDLVLYRNKQTHI